MFSEERLDESDLMSPEETAIFDEMDDILDEYSDGSSQADLVSLNSCTSSPAVSSVMYLAHCVDLLVMFLELALRSRLT